MQVESHLADVTAIVDERLAVLLPDPAVRPQALHKAMRYSCLAPGKRLRPALCMASSQAVGAQPESVLDAACSLEMVHAFSLIHDDLPAIDDDDLRRGLPTCHKKFGEAIALLAGDALFALAYETLSRSAHDPARVVTCLGLLSRAAGSDGLVGGEVVDVESEGKAIDPATLEFIHTRKTGSLVSASCQVGALLGGGSEQQVSRLAEYGAKVGLAFQIADDLLNELSTAEVLGKSAGSDRHRMKATYPALFGVDEARNAAKDTALQACGLAIGFPNAELLQALAQFAVDRLA